MSHIRTWFPRLACAVISAGLPLVATAQETRVVAPGAELELTPPGGALTVEAALDGGVLQPVSGGRLKAPEAGRHWLAVRSRDALGRSSPVRWVRLVVDGTGPRLAVTVDPPPVEAEGVPWVPVGATVRVSASDDLAGLGNAVLRVGDREIPAEGGKARATLESEGPVSVTVVATDRVGNRSEQRLHLAVDGTAPEVHLRLEGPTATDGSGGLAAGPATTIRVESDDSGSGVARRRVVLDGAPTSEERLRSPMKPGRHTVRASAVDRVGNRSATTLTFVTDVAAPTIDCRAVGAAEVNAGGRSWYRPPLVVTCTARDDAAGVAVLERDDGGVWRPVEGPFEVAGGEAALRARDRVGNQRGQRFRWAVDKEAPKLGLELKNGTVAAAGEPIALAEGDVVRPAVTDSGCGVGRVEYRIGDGRWAVAPTAIRFIHRGRYRLHVRACDALDNCTEAVWPTVVTRGGAS